EGLGESMTATTANNSTPPERRFHPLSLRLYRFLLMAYPLNFRREYAPHMAQVFRDCYRAEKSNRGLPGVCRLMLRTLLDLMRTAFWTLLIINGALLLVTVFIGSRVGGQFRIGSVVVGYLVSFAFWFSLHWIWAKGKGQLAVSSKQQ